MTASSHSAPRCIPRRATARQEMDRSPPQPLAHWREAAAFVLLADPGAGKSTSFQSEAQATGGLLITARAFVHDTIRPDWRGRVLFIDGLDEMRAGTADGHDREQPLRQLQRRLDELGRPRFRLSCREADWIGAVDAEVLRLVVPEGQPLIELRLEPLDADESAGVLAQWPDKVPDPTAFMHQARQAGIEPLLGNPLLLGLLVETLKGDRWPTDRQTLYARACEQMAQERNPVHGAARRSKPVAREVLLREAGLLCAVLLLSGASAWTYAPEDAERHGDLLIEAQPEALGVRHLDAVFASKLFTSDGDRRQPLHRTIAEYLAARSIAEQMRQGLPMGRVLALMSGVDGGIVEPLRGLHAWLAVQVGSSPQRTHLIERDPLGVVLYGDVRGFSTSDKHRVLNGLSDLARQYPWFRGHTWQASPFGALGTPDMAPVFSAFLQSPDRSAAHQSMLDCVLDAIRYSDHRLATLLPLLEALIRDDSHRRGTRVAALQAGLSLLAPDLSPARRWLDDVRQGVIEDADDELCGHLLKALYPDWLSVEDVLDHFHPPKSEILVGAYWYFWQITITRTTIDMAALADALPAFMAKYPGHISRARRLKPSHNILSAALQQCGEVQAPERLFRWLEAGMDHYGTVTLLGSEEQEIRTWLSEHPAIQKAVFQWALFHVPLDDSGAVRWWQLESVLYKATRPKDWYRWLLDLAAITASKIHAEACFMQAASAALQEAPWHDLTMDEVAQWVEAHTPTWPDAADWLSRAWSLPIDHWLSQHHADNKTYLQQERLQRIDQQATVRTHLEALRDGSAAPLGLLRGLALAHDGRYQDLKGNTPQERLADFMGVAPHDPLIEIALTALKHTLQRHDLPSAEAILKLDQQQRHHHVQHPCLIGATLAADADPQAPFHWPDALCQQLIAFLLTSHLDEAPPWMVWLCLHRETLVAPLLIRLAVQRLRHAPGFGMPGLALLRRSEMSGLARQVLPELLRRVPSRGSEALWRGLNEALLPLARQHMSPAEITAIAHQRLALKSLDDGQRIAWRVATLPTEPEEAASELLRFISTSQTRTEHFVQSLTSQFNRDHAQPAPEPETLSRLIELLGPHTHPMEPEGAGWVDAPLERAMLMRSLIAQIAQSPTEAAALALTRLHRLPTLHAWHAHLQAAQFDQGRLRRAACFQHASAAAVTHTLANQQPANAADLAALLLDHLKQQAKEIRGDDTNTLSRFWRDKTAAGPPSPRVENECRDLLLDRLRRALLPLGVTLEKEHAAAFDKRADLAAILVRDGQRQMVPVEIKKEDHPALWLACTNQLDRLYTIDPAAQGIGIYLVLWFGHNPRATPEGKRPRSVSEMQQWLIERLPESDRHRLPVCVLDLSIP